MGGGGGGIDEGCRPRARKGVEEEGPLAAAATMKVAGPAPAREWRRREHGRWRRQQGRLQAPRPRKERKGARW